MGAQAVAHGVEVDVAGDADGFDGVGGVAQGLVVLEFEVLPDEAAQDVGVVRQVVARAGDGLARLGKAAVLGFEEHEGLDDRAGRILGGEGAVEQGLVFFVAEERGHVALPRFTRDCGGGDGGEDVA